MSEAEAATTETTTPSEAKDTLLGQGISEPVAAKLIELPSEHVKAEELDDRAIEALKEFSDDDALKVIELFAKSDLGHVNNKSAFLCGVMKTFRAKLRKAEAGGTVEEGGPNEEKVKELLERTGYSLEITTGQRKYGGPPPGWEGTAPGCGEQKFCSQIFVGKIPRDMFEDELVPMFEPHGTIYEFRLMVDSMSGLNKGFAFCTYTTNEDAKEAVKALDKKVMKDGKILGVCLSLPNNRLFVGSIPKAKTKEEIMEEFKDKVEEMTDVIVYANTEDPKLPNRGFAFLEFNSHKDASVARKKLMSGKIKVFGNITPTVDWADPQEEPDEETMAKVKTIYIKNLTDATDDEKLKEIFKEYGEISSVKKVKNYAFIEFAEREGAEKAIEGQNGQELEEKTLEIVLAKPMQDKKKRKGASGFGALSRGGSRGRAGFRGRGRGGPPRGRGGAPPPFAGGYGYPPYGGFGYGYDDGTYDGYYQAPPMRGGPRGGPRGMPPRGGFRGGPRGMPPRGRGAPGGRGMPPRGGPAGAKRKMENGADPAAAKKKFGGAQGWTPQPIAQQPLSQGYYGGGYGGEWYHDSYGQQW